MSYYLKILFILFETERGQAQAWMVVGGVGTGKSRLPVGGLEGPWIMIWPKGNHLTNGATRAPMISPIISLTELRLLLLKNFYLYPTQLTYCVIPVSGPRFNNSTPTHDTRCPTQQGPHNPFNPSYHPPPLWHQWVITMLCECSIMRPKKTHILFIECIISLRLGSV